MKNSQLTTTNILLIFGFKKNINVTFENTTFKSISMKIFKILSILFLSISVPTFTQTPTDYLPADFHKERREALRAKMPANSVAVVFANPLRNRANDVDYVFHQDPNFYYLTGYREPNGVLVLFSDEQTDADGNTYDEILYVQKRDPRAEQWNGKRLGVEGSKS